MYWRLDPNGWMDGLDAYGDHMEATEANRGQRGVRARVGRLSHDNRIVKPTAGTLVWRNVIYLNRCRWLLHNQVAVELCWRLTPWGLANKDVSCVAEYLETRLSVCDVSMAVVMFSMVWRHRLILDQYNATNHSRVLLGQGVARQQTQSQTGTHGGEGLREARSSNRMRLTQV